MNPKTPELQTQLDANQVDAQLTGSLEQKPFVQVPAGFAASAALRAAALPVRAARRKVSYGRAASLAGAILLLLLMFSLAPSTQPVFTNVAFDLELLAATQLIAIAYWLTGLRQGSH